MRFNNLILLASLLIATEEVQAGKPITGTDEESDAIPVWRVRRINAVEWSESGPHDEPSAATEAFNYLQDQLGKPHVKEVLFHPDTSFFHDDNDFFYWRGPKTGRRMTMSREKFFKDILFPYFTVIESQDNLKFVEGMFFPYLDVIKSRATSP
jgi:hypothetical protein